MSRIQSSRDGFLFEEEFVKAFNNNTSDTDVGHHAKQAFCSFNNIFSVNSLSYIGKSINKNLRGSP